MLFVSKHGKLSKGLSLIEASMVLALSAVVVSGVLYYYNNASSNRKLEEDSKTIQMVISTIRTLYENQRATVKIDIDAVAKAGNFTTTTGSNGNTNIVMPTGETLSIIDGTSSFKNRLYAIDFYTKDKNICAHLASARYGTSHFLTTVVKEGGSVSFDINNLQDADDRYLSVDEAASTCSSVIDSNGTARVYMAFKG